MFRQTLIIGSLICALCVVLLAQNTIAPKPPFTAKDVERGMELQKAQWKARNEVTDFLAPLEPFKIAGNLYFVGIGNGDAYLLTSPQGHIIFGTGFNNTMTGIENNIQKLGFKVTDIKAILINHNHGNQSGGAAYFREKSGGQLMAGFAEVPWIENGGALPGPPPAAAPPAAPRGGGQPAGPPPSQINNNMWGVYRMPVGGMNVYKAAHVDRALFNGDVIKVGPLSVTAWLIPLHTLGSVSYTYTVREGNRDLRAIQYCCWELPDDYGNSANISDAAFQYSFDTLRKLMPIDLYMESGTWAWGGLMALPMTMRWEEKIAKLRSDPKLFVDRNIFPAITAAREASFMENIAKVRARGSAR
jgi:glyoxylase-like metal-dependent hydrolase (beta-lactamase superfamily II)